MKIRKDVDETAPPCGNSVVKTTYMYFTVAAQRPSTCGSSGTGDAGCAGGASSTGTVAQAGGAGEASFAVGTGAAGGTGGGGCCCCST